MLADTRTQWNQRNQSNGCCPLLISKVVDVSCPHWTQPKNILMFIFLNDISFMTVYYVSKSKNVYILYLRFLSIPQSYFWKSCRVAWMALCFHQWKPYLMLAWKRYPMSSMFRCMCEDLLNFQILLSYTPKQLQII